MSLFIPSGLQNFLNNPQTMLFLFTPWMKTAYGELGQSEVSGAKANPQILNYFKASKYWGTDDSGGKNAWCGSFVAWVMKKNGHTPVKSAFRAKSWKNFGKTIKDPVFGAIAIKSRKGGGHVGFVVGKSVSGKKLFILGGNQGDKVSIKEYPLNVWETFVVPTNFNQNAGRLPVYTGSAEKAGSES